MTQKTITPGQLWLLRSDLNIMQGILVLAVEDGRVTYYSMWRQIAEECSLKRWEMLIEKYSCDWHIIDVIHGSGWN